MVTMGEGAFEPGHLYWKYHELPVEQQCSWQPNYLLKPPKYLKKIPKPLKWRKYFMNPLYDHDRSQNFGNCSKILKVVQKQLYSVSLEVSNLFNYDLNV